MPKVRVRKHQSAPKPKKSGPEDASLIPRGPPVGKWYLTICQVGARRRWKEGLQHPVPALGNVTLASGR